MTTRREFMHRTGSITGALLLGASAPASSTWAATQTPRSSRLETRMFNFRPDLPGATTDSMIARLGKLADVHGRGGFMMGRNLSAEPFPTRFEWIYLLQIDAARANESDPDFQRYLHLRDELTSLCARDVECALETPLPPHYAAAPGVNVRHTVMFDFKQDATEDARERNVAAIRQMGQLPMVQHYLVQRTSLAHRSPTQMEWQVIGDFASLEDYQAYSNAPVHLAIREDFTTHTSRVAFIDVKL